MSFDLTKQLKVKPKPVSKKAEKRLEEAEERAGFEPRDPVKKRGRPKSPYTNQFHCMLKPETDEWIRLRHAETQYPLGAIIEELFQSHKKLSEIE